MILSSCFPIRCSSINVRKSFESTESLISVKTDRLYTRHRRHLNAMRTRADSEILLYYYILRVGRVPCIHDTWQTNI